MVDYIKIYYQDKARFESFVCNPENFEEVDAILGLHSGNVKYPYCTEFSGMEVRVTSKHGYVRNSIHKAFNEYTTGENHNYNDFNYYSICEAIDYISSQLIDVDKAKLTQLEFGLNIEVPIPARDIIRQNVLMHKLKGPNHNRLFNGLGELKQFDYHNHFIKIYDKAKQYRLNYHLLRFEVKFIKAKEFQKMGIYHLTDLKKKHLLRKLFLNLMLRFEEMTIVDSYLDEDISSADLNKLCRYNNPTYWEQRISHLSNQTKMRYHRDYVSLLQKYDLLHTKNVLRELLLKKYIKLINH
tara:strand:- start:2151 stop:3041 length:891 start_codon:yes stop_codon:yes gene_type:complete